MNNNLPIFHGDDDDTDDDGDYSDDDEMFLNSLSTNQAECYQGPWARVSRNAGLPPFTNQNTHRPGRRFRTNLMSRYICFSPNGQFDVRFEELVSKAKNPGGFLRKNVFRVHFWGFFL